MLFRGHAANMAPLLPASEPVWWQGAAGIFANCAFLLCGFQAISQVVEEKSHMFLSAPCSVSWCLRSASPRDSIAWW